MTMNQEKPKVSGQFEYMGRWVDKKHFRTFVYNEIENKLAESYEEYQKLISSGLWYDSHDAAISSKVSKEFEESVQKAEENMTNVIKLGKKPIKPKLVR